MAYLRDEVAHAFRQALEADIAATKAELDRFISRHTSPEIVRCVKKLRRLEKKLDEFDWLSPRLLH